MTLDHDQATLDGAASPVAVPATATAPTWGPAWLRPIQTWVHAVYLRVFDRYAKRAVMVYVGAHLMLVSVMLGILARRNYSPAWAFKQWDGYWYLAIAHGGYEHHWLPLEPDGSLPAMKIAFFPLYPYMMRSITWVTGMPLEASGMVISVVCVLVAAIGIDRLVRLYLNPRVSLLVVALWAIVPAAYLETMVYTEAFFTAFAVWTVYALARRRWITAGVLTGIVGLAHSTATALVGVVWITALLTLARNRDRWRDRTLWLRPLVASAIAPLGLFIYWGFLALRFHRLDAWFYAEKANGWGSEFDLGWQTLHVLYGQLFFYSVNFDQWMGFIISTLMLVAGAISCILLLWNHKVGKEILTWAALTMAIAACTAGTYGSKPRELLPCIPLLIPPAMFLARTRPKTQIMIIAVIAILGGWLGAYYLAFTNVAP
jgi:hypothetical protein